MLKRISLFAFLNVAMLGFSQQYNIPAVSPRQTVEQQFSVTKISVEYRKTCCERKENFGELVPFGQVWRAGANETSRITFGQDVVLVDKKLKRSVCSLHSATRKEWKIILNKGINNWELIPMMPKTM